MGFPDSCAGDDDGLPYDHDDYDAYSDLPRGEPIRRRSARRDGRNRPSRSELRAAHRPERDAFRCCHCRTLVGPAIGGGRYRNHCPLCLYSRHVDRSKPGDRSSDCRARMAPVGVFLRLSGEQVIVHRCLGCGVKRHNRVAADDNPLAVMRLPLLEAQTGGHAADKASSA